MKIQEHNCETNEIVIRELTSDEFAQYEADQAVAVAEAAEEVAKAQARQALLDKLGITEDEAKLLLGGN